MSKYEGIHKPSAIDVELSDAVKNIQPPQKSVWLKNLITRTIIAALLLGAIFGISRMNLPFSEAFTNGIRQAITMEFFTSPSIVDRDEFLIDLLRPSNTDE